MSKVLVHDSFSKEQCERLQQEFPLLDFHYTTRPEELSEQESGEVEVWVGKQFSLPMRQHCRRLRWVHCPIHSLEGISRDLLHPSSNLLLSHGRVSGVDETAEFVLAGILGWTRGIFPHLLGSLPEPRRMQGLRFLQIHFGPVGSAIARLARRCGMRVWGAAEKISFHPECERVFSLSALHSLLPSIEVVSLTLFGAHRLKESFWEEECALLSPDAIFCLTEVGAMVTKEDLDMLADMPPRGGVVVDSAAVQSLPKSHQLFKRPDSIVTPGIARQPAGIAVPDLALFRYNLRQFLHGNYWEMRDLVNPPPR